MDQAHAYEIHQAKRFLEKNDFHQEEAKEASTLAEAACGVKHGVLAPTLRPFIAFSASNSFSRSTPVSVMRFPAHILPAGS